MKTFFLWKCYNNGLPTISSLHHQNITSSPSCPLCYSDIETFEHALRDCVKVTPVWMDFITPANFFIDNYQTWLLSNSINNKLNKLNINKLNIPWSTIYLFILYVIWLSRNRFIFQNETKLLNEIANFALSKLQNFGPTQSQLFHQLVLAHLFLSILIGPPTLLD